MKQWMEADPASADPRPVPGTQDAAGPGSLRIPVALVLAVLLVYSRVCFFGFVDYDDGIYVTANPWVRSGLTWDTVRWAFGTGAGGNWQPLTWLSHALDVTLFGLRPAPMHLVNVLLHAANAVLMYRLWLALTGRTAASAMVAFLFALHPLHVESVAWISERKDVLSTLFWLLTSFAYLRYLRQPSTGRYAALAALFTAGLMSKAMLVTLPLTLLLLDAWPLGRIDLTAAPATIARRVGALLREKWLLFAILLAVAASTFRLQDTAGAVTPFSELPLLPRLCNAAMALAQYLLQMVWPLRLAAFYPHPFFTYSVPGSVAAMALAAAVTWLALAQIHRRPWLAFGWFWYLVTLAPVIGIIQTGAQAHADRYTYIPLTGIFVILAWEGPLLWERWRLPRPLGAGLATALVATLALLAWNQAGTWRDTYTLFDHARQVTRKNYLAHEKIGRMHLFRNQYREALEEYRKVVKIIPTESIHWVTVGDLCKGLGKPKEARAAYRKALDLNASAQELRHLAFVLSELGFRPEAKEALRKLLRANPGDLEALRRLRSLEAESCTAIPPAS